MKSFFSNLFGSKPTRRPGKSRKTAYANQARLTIEALEDRCLMATAVTAPLKEPDISGCMVGAAGSCNPSNETPIIMLQTQTTGVGQKQQQAKPQTGTVAATGVNSATPMTAQAKQKAAPKPKSPKPDSSYYYPEHPLPATWNDSMQSLNEVIDQVKAMRLLGRSNQEIAEYVTGAVDDRIQNLNDYRVGQKEADVYLTPDGVPSAEGLRLSAELSVLRQALGVGLDWTDPQATAKNHGFTGADKTGNMYALRAEASWNFGYGNCHENAAISYHILKEAGFTNLRILAHGDNLYDPTRGGIGHVWVVMDMNANADVTKPMTWGADALVIDAWQRVTLKGGLAVSLDQAISFNGRHRVYDATAENDDPRLYQKSLRWVAGQTFNSKLEEALAIKKARKANGILLNLRPTPSVGSGELIQGVAQIRLGADFRAKMAKTKKPMFIEVTLGVSSPRTPFRTLTTIVQFKPGEEIKDIAIEQDPALRMFAPADAADTPLTLKLYANERGCKPTDPRFTSNAATVNIDNSFDLKVNVVDDLTGKPIPGARVGVKRFDQVSPMASGDTDAAGATTFKELLTKDPADAYRSYYYKALAGVEGYASAESVYVSGPTAADQNKEITIRLVKLVSLRIKVDPLLRVTPFYGSVRYELRLKGEATPLRIGSTHGGYHSEVAFENLPVSKDGKILQYQVTVESSGFVSKTVDFAYDPQRPESETEIAVQLAVPYRGPYKDMTGSQSLTLYTTSCSYERVTTWHITFATNDQNTEIVGIGGSATIEDVLSPGCPATREFPNQKFDLELTNALYGATLIAFEGGGDIDHDGMRDVVFSVYLTPTEPPPMFV